jgi:two-component system, NarL family, nitrate/nitrite response regulator NarL
LLNAGAAVHFFVPFAPQTPHWQHSGACATRQSAILRKWVAARKEDVRDVPQSARPASTGDARHMTIQLSAAPRSVAVLDANPVLSDGLAMMISSQPDMRAVTHAFDSSLTLDVPGTSPIDVFILDPLAMNLSPQEIVTRAATRGRGGTFPGSGGGAVLGYCTSNSTDIARDSIAAGFRAFVPRTTRRMVAQGGIYIDAVYANAVAGGVTRKETPFAGGRPLTERERVVLKSVALGMSLKEIGAMLDLSSKTVETYKVRAAAKLNLQGRREIVDYALRSGWV